MTMITVYYVPWRTIEGYVPVQSMDIPYRELPKFVTVWKADFEIWW